MSRYSAAVERVRLEVEQRAKNRQTAILAAGLAVLHLVVSFAIFAVLYAAGMHRFDHGGEPAAWEDPAKAVLYVLAQPAYAILAWFPALRAGAVLETVLFLFNSLLWGLAAACVFEWLAAFRSRTDAKH